MLANILIVEDDAVVLTYYRYHLKGLEKADIRECTSGAEAIQLLDSFEPDLVIMDYHLPDITGLELTSLLVMKYPAVIVIAISGDSRKELESEMLEIGAVSFLKKPVNSRVLYLTMQNLIEIVLSRKERKKSEANKSVEVKAERKKPVIAHHEEKTEAIDGTFCAVDMSSIENHLLTSKALPKSPTVFFKEMAEEYEYIDEFLDSTDDVSYSADNLYDNMDIESLLEAGAALEASSRKLNYIQEFPIVAFSVNMISENLNKLNYESIGAIPFKKLCMFVYDYSVLYLRWVKSVFKDRTTEDVHFMDFELIGYVMQMESIFYDADVLSEDDESTTDEGGSIEFF